MYKSFNSFWDFTPLYCLLQLLFYSRSFNSFWDFTKPITDTEEILKRLLSIPFGILLLTDDDQTGFWTAVFQFLLGFYLDKSYHELMITREAFQFLLGFYKAGKLPLVLQNVPEDLEDFIKMLARRPAGIPFYELDR